MTIRSIFAVAAFVTLPLAAFAQGDQPMSHGDHNAAVIHESMMPSMTIMQAMEPTGDVDRDFAMMMIPHHQGAIDMARVELEHGEDPELQALAEKIIADQEREIAQLEEWLAENPE